MASAAEAKPLWQVAPTGSRELFTFTVIATAIGIAYGASSIFSVSFALGAFFAAAGCFFGLVFSLRGDDC